VNDKLHPQHNVLLVINCGSSSLKASCFQPGQPRLNFHFRIDRLDKQRTLLQGLDNAFQQLFSALGEIIPTQIAHRFVFGGEHARSPTCIDRQVISRLELMVPYAPIHLPLNLHGVQCCAEHFSNQAVTQWACFDHTFHNTMPTLAHRLPIPTKYALKKFGFHGLNYAHVARQLPKLLEPTIARGKVVIAHLGSGCSLCMLEALQSVDTSMGLSTAGGIPMATRSGDLDPGVVLTLSETMPWSELNALIFQESGLLALSDGESSDMQTLLTSQSANAMFAITYFSASIRAMVGAYAAKYGGIDALVFTGGIGEHAPEIRTRICTPLSFLGLSLCASANQKNETFISTKGTKPILIVPADEEAEMAALTLAILKV